MNAIALGLGLADGYFERFCDKMDHNLRLLHYPKVARAILDRDHQSRTGAHTDYGSLTLLFQDDRGGLQVKNFDNQFVPAPPIPGTIVINAGDLLARWSNDLIKSTEHRVVSPPYNPAEDIYPARYSIPFFCNPNFDALIECLEVCKSAERPAKYAPILSGDHLVERLATTYK
ncbi:hypothetical protein HDU91_004270 [Kappamyces sp. JEL0680]|nr:hypothetical protein HDU91_004270 [Kappamyces sp. JEL0680]